MNDPLYRQIKSLPKEYILERLNSYIIEDSPLGDPTSDLTIQESKTATSFLVSEDFAIFSGSPIILALDDFEVELLCNDGDSISPNQKIAIIKGNAKKLLQYERILLNLLQRLVGISTLTKQYADILENSQIKILDTRKTTPGLRLFEKYAVSIGGGYNHRLNLSEGLLIKDNHWVASSEDFYKIIKEYDQKIPLQVEVDRKEQLSYLLEYDIDAILLDNMSPEYATECIRLIRNVDDQVFIEISGGITLDNLPDYIIDGVDGISSGALMHQAQNKKIKLEFE
ncbi:MAG: carboxylating nicotinate-nucleotide diphosphorylase [Dehalococcoidia bacterium]